jgi:TolB protein
MDADGGDVRGIETGLADIGGRSDWSPDGQWLAFYAGPSGDRDIFLTAIDGAAVYQLTDGGGNLAPSFSPDGNWVAFTSYRDGDAEIFIMNSDGSNVRQLTFNDRPDWQPRWGR